MISRRHLAAAAAVSVLLGTALTGCGDKASSEVTLTVGATPVPHADILKFIAPVRTT